MAIAQGKGSGGGLSLGKGGGAPSTATRQTLPTSASGKPVVQKPGGDLAGMLLGNRPAQDLKLAPVTQPTRPVLGSIAPTPTRPPVIRPVQPAPRTVNPYKEGRNFGHDTQMMGLGAAVEGGGPVDPYAARLPTMIPVQRQRPPSMAARLAAEINRRAAARRG